MDAIIKIKELATVGNKLLVSSEFHACTNVASFITVLNAIVNKMQSLNIVLDDATIVGKAVQCLLPKFYYFRQSWRLSAPKFAKLSDLSLTGTVGAAFVERKPRSSSMNAKNACRYKNIWYAGIAKERSHSEGMPQQTVHGYGCTESGK
ncbi:hypothetical protein TTRE_0000828801 [Trichuris trichiura]|uniref:Uncharacterized protein n=1 Tax=Trichuris trichiura TaxID=36087 RepID=A0A077ZHU8_TRITR|nr:hypothetical protein TTRE_0000828801 [Trichuris trichiura]